MFEKPPMQQSGGWIVHIHFLRGSRMKRLATIVMAVVLATAGVSAQDDVLCRAKAGDALMLFTLNGLQNIGAGSFNGGVGMGYYIGNGLQIRAGVGFGTNSETSGEGDAEQKETNGSFSIVPALRYNLVNSSTVCGYTGLQVGFMSTSGSTSVGGTETGSTSSSTISAGLILGAEWFAWRNISLSLEYGFGYSSTSGTQKNGQGTETDLPTTSGINLGLSTVQFALALYFN